MNKLERFLLGGTALVGAGLLMLPEADAQTTSLPGGVTAVQQSSARADAASFDAGTTYTNCTTTQVSAANLTITITPPAGNYVYLASVTAEQGSNATGAAAASVAALSTTNLTGAPAWLLDTNTGSQSISSQVVNQVFPTGLKSTSAGTNVTIVPTATLASTYVCIQAAGWYSPL